MSLELRFDCSDVLESFLCERLHFLFQAFLLGILFESMPESAWPCLEKSADFSGGHGSARIQDSWLFLSEILFLSLLSNR